MYIVYNTNKRYLSFAHEIPDIIHFFYSVFMITTIYIFQYLCEIHLHRNWDFRAKYRQQ